MTEEQMKALENVCNYADTAVRNYVSETGKETAHSRHGRNQIAIVRDMLKEATT